MNVEKIAALNDAARTTLTGCRVVVTQGVAALGDVGEVFERVCSYADFNERIDPHREHDFGSFEFAGQLVFWKIDLYEDPDVKSANDPTAITRVITIMLPSDY